MVTRKLLQENGLNHSDLNDKKVYCIDFSKYGFNIKQLINNIFMKFHHNHKAYLFNSFKKSIK